MWSYRNWANAVNAFTQMTVDCVGERESNKKEGENAHTKKKIRSIEIEAAAVFSLYVGEDFANRNVEISMRIIWKRYRESKVRQKDFDWWLWKTAADSGRVCGVFSFLRVFFGSCVC